MSQICLCLYFVPPIIDQSDCYRITQLTFKVIKPCPRFDACAVQLFPTCGFSQITIKAIRFITLHCITLRAQGKCVFHALWQLWKLKTLSSSHPMFKIIDTNRGNNLECPFFSSELYRVLSFLQNQRYSIYLLISTHYSMSRHSHLTTTCVGIAGMKISCTMFLMICLCSHCVIARRLVFSSLNYDLTCEIAGNGTYRMNM